MMEWRIAEAKQQFSEVVRASRQEPQLILRRDRLVAAMVNPKLLEEFLKWQERKGRRSLGKAFEELRQLCREENYEFQIPVRFDRANPFTETIHEDDESGRHERDQ